VPRRLLTIATQRLAQAVLLVVLVSSAAMLLTRLAPGDHLSTFDLDPAVAAAERARLRLDRPFLEQYASWLGRAVRFDFGESIKYGRPVRDLLAERTRNTALLAFAALLLATAAGIPVGIITGSRSGPVPRALARASLVLVSIPPLITSFGFLLLAATTGWFPVGGLDAGGWADPLRVLRSLVLPTLALALPIGASLERIQSQAMAESLREPCVRAALARGCSERRVIWRHALKLSLIPVLAVYGILVGSVLGGSFAVEVVMAWPGLGALMYEALVGRDLHLVAGCASAGAAFLAGGILAADLALVWCDPRTGDPR
jgi:peptide/nickel transport system permease protein